MVLVKKRKYTLYEKDALSIGYHSFEEKVFYTLQILSVSYYVSFYCSINFSFILNFSGHYHISVLFAFIRCSM